MTKGTEVAIEGILIEIAYLIKAITPAVAELVNMALKVSTEEIRRDLNR